jgi:hypothetical protein
VLIVRSTRSGGSSGEAGTVTPSIVAVIKLRPQLTALATSKGGVWVSSQNTDALGGGGAPGYVWRIDPRKEKVAHRLSLDGGGEGIAAAAGSIWTVDAQGARRIDPYSDRIVRTIPEARAGDVVGAGDSIWIGGSRIDPRTNRVVAHTREQVVLTGPLGTWTFSPDGAELHRIDADGRVLAAVRRAGFHPSAAAAGEGSVWVAAIGTRAFELTSVYRIDPRTNRIGGDSISLRGQVPGAVAVADGYVWVLTHNAEERGARLWQIDPHRARVVGRSLHLPRGTPSLLTAGRHALWVGEDLDEGTVTRIDLRPSG